MVKNSGKNNIKYAIHPTEDTYAVKL